MNKVLIPRIFVVAIFAVHLVLPFADSDGQEQDDADGEIRRHVVKVWSSRRSLSLTTPWKRGETSQTSGSGVWLGDGKILTNAHVVMYSSQLDVQPYDSSERISAEVEAVSPEMDLAILKLEESSAFDGLTPLELATELPQLGSSIQAYGYPKGGVAISVTEGVVSRIEYVEFGYEAQGLRIQIDAGINPGNSGGPAISNGRVVGLVFSRLGAGDNIGYLIPGEELATFIADVNDGSYDGKPGFRITTQGLRNKSFRKYLNLNDDQTGVVVIDTEGRDENYPLRTDDVITHVGNHELDNDGMVRKDDGIRLSFQYFVPGLSENKQFSARIIRDGREMNVEIPVDTPTEKLIPDLKGQYPVYFVYGPAVFSELTADYLNSYLAAMRSDPRLRGHVAAIIKDLVAEGSPIMTRAAERSDQEKLVFITSPLLPHKIAKGYSGFGSQVLSQVNGVKIKNIQHLIEVLRDTEEDFVRFEFADNQHQQLILERKLVEESTEEILDEYSIPRQGSRSLLKIWDAEATDDQ